MKSIFFLPIVFVFLASCNSVSVNQSISESKSSTGTIAQTGSSVSATETGGVALPSVNVIKKIDKDIFLVDGAGKTISKLTTNANANDAENELSSLCYADQSAPKEALISYSVLGDAGAHGIIEKQWRACEVPVVKVSFYAVSLTSGSELVDLERIIEKYKFQNLSGYPVLKLQRTGETWSFFVSKDTIGNPEVDEIPDYYPSEKKLLEAGFTKLPDGWHKTIDLVSEIENISQLPVTYSSVSDATKDPVNDYAFGSDGKIYYITNGGVKLEVKGADADSFHTIDNAFGIYNAKDANHVFAQENIIPWADPKTFEQPSKSIDKDATHVYIGVTQIVGADPASIEELDMNYFKDKSQVYYYDSRKRAISVIQDADVATFSVPEYNSGKAKDSKSEYENGSRVGVK